MFYDKCSFKLRGYISKIDTYDVEAISKKNLVYGFKNLTWLARIVIAS